MKFSKSFREHIYVIAKQIPRGKVATYGQIATALRKQPRLVKLSQAGVGLAARAVGNALHQNDLADVPCHRVVDRNGRLAPNFAFGGWRGQRRRLLTEGVRFRDNMHVDLEQCKFTLGFMGKSKEFSSGPVPRTRPIV